MTNTTFQSARITKNETNSWWCKYPFRCTYKTCIIYKLKIWIRIGQRVLSWMAHSGVLYAACCQHFCQDLHFPPPTSMHWRRKGTPVNAAVCMPSSWTNAGPWATSTSESSKARIKARRGVYFFMGFLPLTPLSQPELMICNSVPAVPHFVTDDM